MRFKYVILLTVCTIGSLVFITSCAKNQSAAITDNQPTRNPRRPAPEASPDTQSNTIPLDVLRPTIISREVWGAKKTVGVAKEHNIRSITIHHTGEPQNKRLPIEKKMQGLQTFSQSTSRLASGKSKPIWFDVPYHYYIAFDGKIAEGREIKYAGDTNTDYDPVGHALVVVEGNFQTEHPTDEQIKSLKAMITWLSTAWKVTVSDIKAHDDYASTACPGVNLKALLDGLRRDVNKSLDEKEAMRANDLDLNQ